MTRSLYLFAAGTLALAMGFCLPGHGQDTPAPSLGDVARQAQKDKDKSKPPAKKVFTNDDLSSGSGSGSSSTNPGPAHFVQPSVQSGAPGKPAAAATASPSSSASASDQLEQIASLLAQLDSLDRATLAKNVLQGNDTDFPGRSAWEERLFAAKQVFVAQEHEIMTKASQFEAASKGVPDTQSPTDPRAKSLSDQLDQLMQEAARSSAAFQAVAAEGKELAGQSSSH